ncbi:hypothetical protein QR680_017538 [Steinernema hermaphroditum]|uniref:aECM cysteine-cradle domain-containing protein n=1 Tax=Steinernema hermaphroditum TaxID=289476 RepID=A0AA39LP75_9BILA|nr:hypothetical protein QR680_017538 [Steinernema hermaphroditum]
MRPLFFLLLVSLSVLLLTRESAASRALQGYKQRIAALREAVNAREASASSASVSKSSKSNPQKTKKYKCVLVEDDDDESVSHEEAKPSAPESPDFDYGLPALEKNNKLWPASNSLPKQSVKSKLPTRTAIPSPSAGNNFDFPKAHVMPQVKALPVVDTLQQPPVVTTVRPNVPTDKNQQPLILSPQHCNQIKYYANMYGVQDVTTWVHKNCAFAKMYLPKATCAEIDILVASCYH